MSYKKKPLERIIAETIVNIANNTDAVTDFNVGSVIRTFIEAVSQKISEAYEELDNVYKGTRINTATGDDLEQLGLLLGIERKKGNKATCEVEFLLSSPVTEEKVIPSGTIVSTIEGLNFITTEDKTIEPSISDEEHIYTSGRKVYMLNSKKVDEVTNVHDSSGTSLSFVLREHKGYILKENTKIVTNCENNSSLFLEGTEELLEHCDSSVGWNTSSTEGIVAENNIYFREGSGSLELRKQSGSHSVVRYSKILPTKSFSGKVILLDYYISNPAKISCVRVIYGNDASNYFYKDFTELKRYWNKLYFSEDEANVVGSVNVNNINYFALEITYVSPSVEVGANEQLVDNILLKKGILLSSDKYAGSFSGRLDKHSTEARSVKYYTYTDLDFLGISQMIKISSSAFEKLKSITVYYGLDENNTFYETFPISDFTPDEWTEIVTNTGQRVIGKIGNPSFESISYYAVEVETKNDSDTLDNEVLIDSVLAGDVVYHEGNVIELVDEPVGDMFYVSYVPLSVSVPVIAEDVGSKYNVGRKKIIKLVSSLPSLGSLNVINYEPAHEGMDVEDDDSLKERIINAVYPVSKASVNSIKYTLLKKEYISDVNVIDRPLYETEETFEYSSSRDRYYLSCKDPVEIQEVVGEHEGIVTSFEVSLDSKNGYISFPTSTPDEGSVFKVKYKYRKRGKVDIIVKGKSNLSEDMITDIEDTVNEIKSSGIDVEIKEAKKHLLTITVNVTTDSDSVTSEEVSEAIRKYVENKKIGEGITVAEIINVVMNIEHVKNVNVIEPTSDVEINDESYLYLFSVSVSFEGE